MHVGQQEQKTNVHFFCFRIPSESLCITYLRKSNTEIQRVYPDFAHKFEKQQLSEYDLGSYGTHAAYCMQ